jgi:RimJ/RimL family protein N-acetyltransferase
VNVRPATIDDAAECAHVHCASSEVAYGRPRDLERTLEAWRGIFENDCAPFVAEEHGAIVGVLNVGPSREEPGVGELYLIYVLAESWGSRAGQLLIERAHQVLSARFDEAVLTVLASNPRARRFYERNGWTLDEVRTEPHFGGEPTEVARYRKRFAHESGSADTESGSHQDRT